MDEGLCVRFESPEGWRPRTKTKYVNSQFIAIFALAGHETEEHPAIDLSVTATVPGKLLPPRKNIDPEDPRTSSTATDMESFGQIQEVRKIASFTAAENGKLPIWKIHSNAYDCLLVLIVYRHTSVDISLRGNDADKLRKYIPDLETVARSIRFVQSGQERPASSPRAAITPNE
jgi:hypothetical protein